MITSVLNDLGVDNTLLGYQYLKYILEFLAEHKDAEVKIGMMDLYAEAAKEFNTTVKCAEQACRSAMRNGWFYRNKNTATIIFGENADVPTVYKYVKAIEKYLRGGNTMNKVNSDEFRSLMDSSINMRLCPHCGHDVEIRISKPMYGRTGARIVCTHCGCQTEYKEITTAIIDEDTKALGTPVTPESLMQGILAAVKIWNGKGGEG